MIETLLNKKAYDVSGNFQEAIIGSGLTFCFLYSSFNQDQHWQLINIKDTIRVYFKYNHVCKLVILK